MAAYEVLLLNTAIPQIQAAQAGDTYVVPRDIAFSTVASFAAGTEALPSLVATGDVNTGFWFPAADTIAASTGGTRHLRQPRSGGDADNYCRRFRGKRTRIPNQLVDHLCLCGNGSNLFCN